MNEINDIINQIDEEVVGKFLQNSETKVSFSKDYEKHEYDYEWLSVMEEVMPYLFNIVKAPKKFIMNEEEVVKVELAKKVTVESIKHLTQHTNLIQDYDPEKGEVIKRFLSWRSRGVFLCCVLAAWCATAWGLEFFNARAPLLDSATTVLSIGAMILSVMRCFEQWICWTLVNSISIFMWSQIYRESGNSIAALLMWVIFFFCGLYFAFCWYKDAGDGK